MDQATWDSFTPQEREAKRDLSDLAPLLIGLEGWRVEVTYTFDSGAQERERGIVGRSTGWKPCHILLKRRDSIGGGGVLNRVLTGVRKLYRVR